MGFPHSRYFPPFSTFRWGNGDDLRSCSTPPHLANAMKVKQELLFASEFGTTFEFGSKSSRGNPPPISSVGWKDNSRSWKKAIRGRELDQRRKRFFLCTHPSSFGFEATFEFDLSTNQNRLRDPLIFFESPFGSEKRCYSERGNNLPKLLVAVECKSWLFASPLESHHWPSPSYVCAMPSRKKNEENENTCACVSTSRTTHCNGDVYDENMPLLEIFGFGYIL